jgi:Leucine-rich repeat (LRR) protein
MKKFNFYENSILLCFFILFSRPQCGDLLVLDQNFVEKLNDSIGDTTIKLSGYSIEAILPEAFSIHRNVFLIKHLSLDYKLLSIVDEYAFSNLTSLITLNLAMNQISWIDPLSFAYLSKLKKLVLSGNSLGFIDDKTFESLISLETLDLSVNKIYSLNSISPLPNLAQLHLNHNKISFLLKNNFRNFKRLKTLELSNNLLSFLDVFPLRYLSKSIVSLDFSYDHLRHIPDSMFSGFECLERLFLSNNKIMTIGYEAFGRSNLLNEISLGYQRIDSIGRVDAGGLERLTHLDLSFNNLTSLSQHLFEHLYNLEILLLNDNLVESLV